MADEKSNESEHPKDVPADNMSAMVGQADKQEYKERMLELKLAREKISLRAP